MNTRTQEMTRNANFTITLTEIANAKPQPGEQAAYTTRTDAAGKVIEDYGLIWMSRSPSGSRLLVLAGRSSTGTAGVGDFFGDPEKMRPVYERLEASAKGGVVPFEWQVLLKVTARDSIPVNVSYVTHRVTDSN